MNVESLFMYERPVKLPEAPLKLNDWRHSPDKMEDKFS